MLAPGRLPRQRVGCRPHVAQQSSGRLETEIDALSSRLRILEAERKQENFSVNF